MSHRDMADTNSEPTIFDYGFGGNLLRPILDQPELPAFTVTAQSIQTQNLFAMRISSNTSGTTALVSSGTLTLAGGNNVTLSQDGNAITISGGAAGSNTAGMSNLGNTSGTTGVVSGSAIRYLLAGGNNITLSQSLDGVSGTLTVSAFNQSAESQSLGMSNLGNTSGTTGIASGAQVRYLLAGGDNITLSQSLDGASGTVTISGAGAPTLNFWQNLNPVSSVLDVIGTVNQSLFIVPLAFNDIFPGNMTANTVLINVSGATQTSISGSRTISFRFGVYTEANSSQLSLLNSVQTTWGTGAANSSQSRFHGEARFLTIDSSAWSIQPSFSQTRYHLGYIVITSGEAWSGSFMGLRFGTADRAGTFGVNNASARSFLWNPFFGRYSAQTSAFPATIGRTQISHTLNDPTHEFIPHIIFENTHSAF